MGSRTHVGAGETRGRKPEIGDRNSDYGYRHPNLAEAKVGVGVSTGAARGLSMVNRSSPGTATTTFTSRPPSRADHLHVPTTFALQLPLRDEPFAATRAFRHLTRRRALSCKRQMHRTTRRGAVCERTPIGHQGFSFTRSIRLSQCACCFRSAGGHPPLARRKTCETRWP